MESTEAMEHPDGLWTAFGSKLGQLGPPSRVGGPPSWPNFDPKLSRNGTPETRRRTRGRVFRWVGRESKFGSLGEETPPFGEPLA